jgi:fructose/tagatose bisphosphate aldolase
MTKVFSCGDPLLGMQGMLSDLRILMSERGPYHRLTVLPHLDHFVPWRDAEILEGYWDSFASVLVDASEKIDADNIAVTRDYAERFRGRLIVEGVVDGIGESGSDNGHVLKTTVEKASEFRERTGVELIVPSVGTEHRSTSQTLEYDEGLAKRISAKVGRALSLHGTSSLNERNFARLSECGFLKINIFTALAVAGGQAVARQILANIGNLFDEKQVAEMRGDGILGANVLAQSQPGKAVEARPRLAHLANEQRRNAWFRAVKAVCRKYFLLLNYSRYEANSRGPK